MPGLRDRTAGPHEELARARGAPESRSHGSRLRARGTNAPEQIEIGGQVAPEEGITLLVRFDSACKTFEN